MTRIKGDRFNHKDLKKKCSSLFPRVSIQLEKCLPNFFFLRPTACCPISRKASAENLNLGSRDGTVVRTTASHLCGLGLIPAWHYMSVKFVAGSGLVPRAFLPPQQPTSNLDSGPALTPAKADVGFSPPAFPLNIVICLLFKFIVTHHSSCEHPPAPTPAKLQNTGPLIYMLLNNNSAY